MSNKSYYEKVINEINEIDQLFETYTPLIKLLNTRRLDLIESTALSQVLHSFYNGIENIFKIISQEEKTIPLESRNWHKVLLNSVNIDLGIISDSCKDSLLEFLGFRHLIRHMYSFDIDSDKVADLAKKMKHIWNQTRKEILDFLNE